MGFNFKPKWAIKGSQPLLLSHNNGQPEKGPRIWSWPLLDLLFFSSLQNQPLEGKKKKSIHNSFLILLTNKHACNNMTSLSWVIKQKVGQILPQMPCWLIIVALVSISFFFFFQRRFSVPWPIINLESRCRHSSFPRKHAGNSCKP